MSNGAQKRVLAVGDVDIDIVFTGLTNLPRAEQDTLADSLETTVGGQTGTIARALVRLGLVVKFVGRVGDDDYGCRCRVELARAGVSVDDLMVDSSLRTGVTVVLSTGTERGFATYLGAISAVRRTDVTPVLLSGADHLHVGSYFLQTTLLPDMLDLFQAARQRGLTTSCDPGWDVFLNWDRGILDVLRHVDVFLPNEVEAMQITHTTSVEAALDTLATRCRITVIKRGGQGCLVRHGAQTIRCSAFNVPVVDVTSAGDIFNAGFLYGFLQGMPLIETIKFASACGALSVSRASNLGMPSVNEVGTFLAARGNQLVIG